MILIDLEVQLPHWGTVRCLEEFCQANSSRNCLETCNVSLHISQHYDGFVKVNKAYEIDSKLIKNNSPPAQKCVSHVDEKTGQFQKASFINVNFLEDE